jgi:GxxExxY protein
VALLHEELTSKILEACFQVSNELGAGFVEAVYHNALLISLREKGLEAESQAPMSVAFHGNVVGQFFADILVEKKIILELKAVTELSAVHQAQVINYLKAAQLDIGLLVNFGRPKLEYRRLHRKIALPAKERINRDEQDTRDS